MYIHIKLYIEELVRFLFHSYNFKKVRALGLAILHIHRRHQTKKKKKILQAGHQATSTN